MILGMWLPQDSPLMTFLYMHVMLVILSSPVLLSDIFHNKYPSFLSFPRQPYDGDFLEALGFDCQENNCKVFGEGI
jgi:hypothetical protein